MGATCKYMRVGECLILFFIVRDGLRIEKWMGPFNGRSVVVVSK
jgi:hypothetical protein